MLHFPPSLLRSTALIAASLVACGSALAQATSPPAASAADPAKRELAVKLASFQKSTDTDSLASQLATNAVQSMAAQWAPKLEASIPAARQQQAGEQVKTELKHYGEEVYKIVQGKVGKITQDALVSAYMDNFSTDELRQLGGIFASPAFIKYQSLGGQLGNAVVQKVGDATRVEVMEKARQFETSANKIVTASKSGGGSSGTAANKAAK